MLQERRWRTRHGRPIENATLLAPLLDIPLPNERAPTLAPDELRRRQLAALTSWVLAGARAQPLVLAVEDAHWADPTTPRNSQRPQLLAVARLGNPHPSNCLGSIRLPAEFVRQFTEPPLFPVCLDVRKFLTVDPRCTFVGFAPLIGVGQHVLAVQLVIQKIEPIVRCLLSFRL